MFFEDSVRYEKIFFRDVVKQFIRIKIEPQPANNPEHIPNYLYYLKGNKTASYYEFLRLYIFGFKDIEILDAIRECKTEIKDNDSDISSLKRLLHDDIFTSGKNNINMKIKKLNDSNEELEKRIKNLDIVNNIVNDSNLINNDKVNIYTLRTEIDKNSRSVQFLEKIKNKFNKNSINNEDMQIIYNYIENFNKNLGEKLNKNFNEVVEFHSKMMSNEIEFIEESIVELNDEIKNNTKNLEEYINKVPVRNELILTTAKSMNENSIEIGKYKEQLEKIEQVEKNEKNLTSKLYSLETNKKQYESDFETKLVMFNEIFQKIHQFVYGTPSNNEFYYSHDEKQKSGQQAESWGVKYRNPDIENASSEGSDIARIIIFNLAYYEFAKKYGLKRPMFIIHDSGITTISQDIREKIYNYIANNKIQVIIATLKEGLDTTTITEYACKEEFNGNIQTLDLSHDNKLFRI